MAMSAAMQFNLQLLSNRTELDYLGSPLHQPRINETLNFADGTGVNQINRLVARRISIASGATYVIDLNGGLTDVFGLAQNFITVCGITIVNFDYDDTPNTTNLTIGAGSAPFLGLFGSATGTHVLRPGGIFSTYCGNTGGIGTVVPTTADKITVVNGSGASNQFQFSVIGRSV